jgi:hypothetical protein
MPSRSTVGAFDFLAPKSLEWFYMNSAHHEFKGNIMTLIGPQNPRTTAATTSVPQAAASALHFGKSHEEEADHFSPHRHEERGFSSAERVKGAVTGAMKAIFQPKSLMIDSLIAVAITVATAWLPGSQLLTIPAYLAISAALRAVKGALHGYQNPGSKQPQHTGGLFMFPISTGN